MDKDQLYKLSRFGEEIVNALPDRKKVAAVKRRMAKWLKRHKAEIEKK